VDIRSSSGDNIFSRALIILARSRVERITCTRRLYTIPVLALTSPGHTRRSKVVALGTHEETTTLHIMKTYNSKGILVIDGTISSEPVSVTRTKLRVLLAYRQIKGEWSNSIINESWVQLEVGLLAIGKLGLQVVEVIQTIDHDIVGASIESTVAVPDGAMGLDIGTVNIGLLRISKDASRISRCAAVPVNNNRVLNTFIA
jgi:hypothetical protein